ncbi:hypothetical protein V5799_022757 [Amblyomma americanum]|uniref:Uncharacterized protein n=1 Tax=Amblyomma americanum TaxID=6943 RepID=A0AAQ4FJL8_AMBAM
MLMKQRMRREKRQAMGDDAPTTSSASTSTAAASNVAESASNLFHATRKRRKSTLDDDEGYKMFARHTIQMLAHNTKNRIFVCGTATPFLTKYDKELMQWVNVFDMSIGTKEDAEAYFGKRLVIPTPSFLQHVYTTTLRFVNETGGWTIPNIVDVRNLLKPSEFPTIGCCWPEYRAQGRACNTEPYNFPTNLTPGGRKVYARAINNASDACVVRRLLSEIAQYPNDKHFVVTYRYEMRERVLDAMRRPKVETALRKFNWNGMEVLFVQPDDPSSRLIKTRDI